MFWASRLDVLQISLAPTITLPAFVMAAKFIDPSFPITLPSVAAFTCIVAVSMSISSPLFSVFSWLPDSQKLAFLSAVLISSTVAVAGR